MRHHRKYKFKKCRNARNRFRKHIKRMTSDNGFYRSRQGVFLGVLKGLANHFNISVFWLRAFAVIAFLFTGFFPVVVFYIIAGLVLKIEPVSPLHDEDDREFYDSYTQSRKAAIQRIKRKFDNIERRIQRMEHTVTSKDFNWE